MKKLNLLKSLFVLIGVLITSLTTLVWSDNYYQVGCAVDNPNSYTVKVGVHCNNWGWYTHDMTEAGLTFEGKKLYLNTINTNASDDRIGAMSFLMYDGSTEKSASTVIASWNLTNSTTVKNKIWDYASNAWYETKTVETSARFYFDATSWNETSIKLVVGHAEWQKYYSLSHIDHTKLYYGNSADKWTDAMHIGVVGNTTASSAKNWPSDISDKANEFTGLKNYGLTSTAAGNVYLMVPTGDAGEQPDMHYYATHYNSGALNNTLTFKYSLSIDNGVSYSEVTEGAVPAQITASSYKFESGTYDAVSSSSLSTTLSYGGSTCSATLLAARTAETTMTIGTHTGYIFVGWYTAASGGDQISDSEEYSDYMPTENATIYARFKAIQYNGTIDKNTGDADKSYVATYGQTSISITTPTKTGYHVTGYYDDAVGTHLVADADGTLHEGVTGFTDASGKWNTTSAPKLYPQWSNEYTITFDQGTPTIQGTNNTIATYGSAMPAVTVPSKTGYIFGGYWTGENGTGTKYYKENGTSETNWNIASNTTLYAQWTPITYQIAFDANEGTGSMDNQDFTYGPDDDATNENLSQNNDYITREGYYFLGWNTRADGTGTKFYDQKPVRNLTTVDGGIVTLYAQWAKTYTLYFIQAKCSWTSFYAKAEISYDGQTYYPKGEGNGTTMTNDTRGIYMSNFTYNSSHNFALYKIDGIPEGSQIKFSDNGSDPKGNMSWSPDKPYYLYGNSTWYALNQYAIPADVDTISTATKMSAHVGATDYGIDQYADGQYAIVELPGSTWYTLKYHNWLEDGWSGCPNKDAASNMITSGTTTGVSSEWALNGANNANIQTTVAGEYKFMLNGWTDDEPAAPKAQVYYPVGVSLAMNKAEAHSGEETTITLTATPEETYLITNPTYYYQMSTDNGVNWTTIATTENTTFDYTFAAIACKFRVVLQNDAGLKSKSTEQTFTVYSTKSFYVYNPYNNETNKWRWLHLYTWDSNNNNTTYNHAWPGGYLEGRSDAEPGDMENGNEMSYLGDNWYYITIDERANCFMLVGESPYNSHQTITCYVSNYIQDGKYMIYTESNQNKVVAYNAKSDSDYRLKYTYVVEEVTKERYSPIYNTLLDNTLVEKTAVTTSMWMDPRDASAKLIVEQGAGEGSWSTVTTFDNNGSDDFDGLLTSAKRTKGDVFKMDLQFNPGSPASATISNVAVNNGPFYVRTDGLDGGWNVYKKADHMLYVNENTLADYNYYLCKWIGTSGTNVKFTIADDYNTELVESYGKEPNASDPLYNRETLPATANVRFSWNSEENTLSRAYLSGSTNASDRFLVLVETTSPSKGLIYDSEGRTVTDAGKGKVSGLNDYELIFKDNGNWVYQVVIQANPNAEAMVTADYNSQVQEFIASRKLLGGTGGTKYRYRFVYDFKTNNLVSAFEPAGADPTIAVSLAIYADLMLIREHQESANQITFASSQSLSEVKKVFGVMQFNKWTLNDLSKTGSHISLSPSLSRYERDLFWISFPFEVKLKDVFGFGEYGTHWIIERYDGKTRAQKGFWADSEPNWKFITPYQRDSGWVLNANEGYILALDLDELGLSSSIWDNSVEDVYLYFPSSGNIGSIADVTSQEVRIDQDGYQCTIGPRFAGGDDRRVKDSYWHCIGVPSYKNTTYNVTTDAPDLGDQEYWAPDGLLYYYKWVPASNQLTIESTTSSQPFKTMHAYMVQYSGTVLTWANVTNVPSSVAARMAETHDKEFRLALIREEEEQDHTYVRLTDDANVTNRFEFNYDLSKEYNAGRGNIWTVTADTVEVAGNSMPKPVQTTLVPVGVKVVANGEYTFSMPEGTNGEDVYLIDNAYGTRTNLGLMPYTVTLTAGTYDSRFALEFGPIQDAPTSLENDGLSRSDELNDANDDVRKVFVGGRLYIIRDGKVYDAAGQRVE